MRSSEHAAHRLLMHSVHTSHLWLKVSPCVSFHIIHACALVSCSLSVSPHPSFYFLVLFLFQLYLMSNSAPDEFSIEDPLCNSSLGSMVTLDYVTPLTRAAVDRPGPGHVYAPLLKTTEDGQGRGVGERVQQHGDDPEDPHSPGGRHPALCFGRG